MAKIVTLEEYLKVHRVGLTVAANGCFDLLAPHHVHLLEEAKKHGDTLVVLLNSDASVRRFKGDDRPVIPQDGRARVLAALACVDYVIIFDGDTPAELLRAIRPSVLVKGDQPGRNTAGDEWCKKIVLVQPVAGSTTETIKKIRGNSA